MRLAVFAKQSAAGLAVPEEVRKVSVFPFFGQVIVTQDIFDAIATQSLDEFHTVDAEDQSHTVFTQGRPVRQPMIDLLTTFLREYGDIHDFDIPTVWI